jgi:hypothetical protein
MALVTRKPERARELEDLIAALDRRVPRVERAGEAAIARDAAALRERAVDRLTKLAGKRRPLREPGR